MPKRNLLLASLSPADLAAIQPHLRLIQLEHRKVLYEAGDQIGTVYFPTSAIVSLVVALSTGEMVEAAMVGRDGLVGASSALDGRISLSRAHRANRGRQLLYARWMRSKALPCRAILFYPNSFATSRRSTRRLSNPLASSATRQCRSAALSLAAPCQGFVRQRYAPIHPRISCRNAGRPADERYDPRPHTIQRAGIIKYSRGKIQILDLEALREAACECYATVNANYRSLLGLTLQDG